MIFGFEELLVGVKKGEEVIVDVIFFEDYYVEVLKGKVVQFVVSVKKVEGLILLKVDEEFVKLFGIEDGDVEVLKVEVCKNMECELSIILKNELKEVVIVKLIEKNEMDVFVVLVE